MSTHSKKILSGKERKELISALENKLPGIAELFPKKMSLTRHSLKKQESLITKGKVIILLEIKGKQFPHIKLVRDIEHTYPIIKVDTGAIKFVTNGADVMRPGITSIDENVNEGSVVLIVEETRSAPLAFGLALYDAVDMKAMKGGKAIKNLHHLKDKYWELPE